jgi:galactose mutarotase-like enzyme
MYGGTDIFALENQFLKVVVLPQNGGKVASIKCTRTDTEFLLPGSQYDKVAEYGVHALFEASDCAGWDECLPTVSISGADTPGGSAPDHGDFWRIPWTLCAIPSVNEICIEAKGDSRPLSFRKQITLDSTELHIKYSITNLSAIPVGFLYASHPLFCIDPGDRIVLPNEIDSLRLIESRGLRIGKNGDRISWPIHFHDGVSFDLRRTGYATDRTAEMLYTNQLIQGSAGLYRTQLGQGVILSFDTTVLPYLGLWTSYGGWPEWSGNSLQYAIALEPTTAPHGSLRDASRALKERILNAAETFSFSLRLAILGCENRITYAQFQEQFARTSTGHQRSQE